MTFGTEWRYDAGGYDYGRLSQNARPQRILAGAGLAGVALLCAWTICANHAGTAADQADVAGAVADQADLAGSRGDKLATVVQRPPAASNSDVARFDFRPLFDSRPLIDSRYSWNFSAEAFSRRASPQEGGQSTATASASSQSTIQKTQDISSLPPRGDRIAQSAALPAPQIRMPQTRTASRDGGAHGIHAASNAPAYKPTLFERLFGKPAALTLAYAAPDDGFVGDGSSITPGRYDRWTAVYDISAHKVYMPDGTTLEAHSGLGSMLDDPRYADARNRGVTPPDVYDLEPRETLFHGVRALRLIPVDDGKVFGRSGLLAHSYMLGPNGDSNGCVSFRNYDAFLQAYMNHEIKRLAVVARVD
jgi:hypothetical protein